MPHQGCANALPTNLGINEQGFYMSAVYQHESNRPIVGIDSYPQRHVRQKPGYHLVDCNSILRQKEVMRRIDRASPYFDNALAIIGAARSDQYHEAAFWHGVLRSATGHQLFTGGSPQHKRRLLSDSDVRAFTKELRQLSR